MRNLLLASTSLLAGACAAVSGPHSSEPVDTARRHRTFEFTYETSIEAPPAGAEQVRLWIPLPTSTLDQKIERLSISASHPYERASIEHGTGQSLCVTSPGEPVHVRVSFECTRYETRGGGRASDAELHAALEPDALVPLNGQVAGMAASLPTSGDRMSDGGRLYRHTLERMRYDKPEDGGGWGRGDSEWACDARYGNCTDFHSYFIGLARAKGIPARFEMGFPIPEGGEEVAEVGGYHCWAYFWSEQRGWVPVDISEADKDPSRAEYFFGTLDEHRVTMVGGRDVLLTPRPAQGALNFFVYPYAEIDDVAFPDVQKSFSRRNL